MNCVYAAMFHGSASADPAMDEILHRGRLGSSRLGLFWSSDLNLRNPKGAFRKVFRSFQNILFPTIRILKGGYLMFLHWWKNAKSLIPVKLHIFVLVFWKYQLQKFINSFLAVYSKHIIFLMPARFLSILYWKMLFYWVHLSSNNLVYIFPKLWRMGRKRLKIFEK